jgi:hypothetical protein
VLEHIRKFKEFALEMIIGFLVGTLGVFQLMFKLPLAKFTSDPELMDKLAAALLTIGGTVLLSGIFRFAISVRLDSAERRIFSAISSAGEKFAGAIYNLQPTVLDPRPDDEYSAYKFLYWRTKDETGTVMWLSFAPFTWRMRVLPLFDAHAAIEEVRGNLRYFLAMVQLQHCLVVTATRVTPDNKPFGEMAGVYIFTIPVGATSRLYGYLRHQNMAGRQSLSPCVLSSEMQDKEDLDQIWVRGIGAMPVESNLPDEAGHKPKMAAE